MVSFQQDYNRKLRVRAGSAWPGPAGKKVRWKMELCQGKTIQPGLAVGVIRFRHLPPFPSGARSVRSPLEEEQRFERAKRQAQDSLEQVYLQALTETSRDNAAIFQIHALMLEDEELCDSIRELIRGGATAEYAVAVAAKRFADLLGTSEDDYMRSRATDLQDVGAWVIAALTPPVPQPDWDEPAILITDRLSPGDLLQTDRRKLIGFVTHAGSTFSHTAILARARRVPAMVGVKIDERWEGRMAVLDSTGGMLYVDPTPQVLESFRQRREDENTRQALGRAMRGTPTITLDGTEIGVRANIRRFGDLDLAVRHDANGIGMLHTDFLFQNREDGPGEDEQLEQYLRVVTAMRGRKVAIRTLSPMPDAAQTARERGGARMLRQRGQLLSQQLRAILRVAAVGPVAAVFPVSRGLEELRWGEEALRACRRELSREEKVYGQIEMGAMMESAGVMKELERLTQMVRLLIVGTDELMEEASQRPDAPQDAAAYVKGLVRQVVNCAHRHGCRVSVSGSMASDHAQTEGFLRMGVDELTVEATQVLPLRSLIRRIDLEGRGRKRAEKQSEDSLACV